MNDRLKFRVWDKVSKRYFYLELKFGDNGYHPDFITDPVFEQCTELSDKNGNLIFEGDVLDCELQDIDSHGYPFIHFKKGVVKRAKNGAYCVEGDDDFYASDITLYPVEIIGNIHEQAEQKD